MKSVLPLAAVQNENRANMAKFCLVAYIMALLLDWHGLLTKDDAPVKIQACKEMYMLALNGLRYGPWLFCSRSTLSTDFKLSLHSRDKIFQSGM